MHICALQQNTCALHRKYEKHLRKEEEMTSSHRPSIRQETKLGICVLVIFIEDFWQQQKQETQHKDKDFLGLLRMLSLNVWIPTKVINIL